MDLDIIIMTAIIIAICILPFIVLSINTSRKEKKIKNILTEIAKAKSGEIVDFDLSRSLAVGITKNDEAFVFYNKKEDGTESKHCILLSEIKKCNLIRTADGSGSGGIGKLILEFEHLDKNRSDVSLEFYNAANDFQIAGELQLVEKWKPMIDKGILAQKEVRQSAQTQGNSMRRAAV